MKKRFFLIGIILCTLILGCGFNSKPITKHNQFSILPAWHPSYQTTFVYKYDSGPAEENELENVQCPIPMDCRVKNYTGIQCVFSALECLARWGDVHQLLEPEPLTSRIDCKSYSGPVDAAKKLKKFNVNFENSYKNKTEGIELIKKAMADGRGALVDIPGHAIVMCHYDENKEIVKIIDNSDISLRIQTWSMKKFKNLWTGWVLVIYADEDPFPAKARKENLANQIKILDRNNEQGIYSGDYIPIPNQLPSP